LPAEIDPIATSAAIAPMITPPSPLAPIAAHNPTNPPIPHAMYPIS